MDTSAVLALKKQVDRERFSTYLLSYIKNGDMNTIKSFRFDLVGGIEGNIKEFTPLTAALFHGKPEIAEYFILHLGAEVKRNDFHDYYPIQIAVGKGFMNIVKICLEKGCSINFMDSQENTLLHTAVENLRLEIAKFLLSKGVDPEKRNVKGVSVLEHISQDVQIPRDIRSQRMKSNIIEFLQNYITSNEAEKQGLPSLEHVSEMEDLDSATDSIVKYPLASSMKNKSSVIQETSDSNDESSSDSPIQLKQRKRTRFPRKGREFFSSSETKYFQTPPILKKKKVSMKVDKSKQKTIDEENDQKKKIVEHPSSRTKRRQLLNKTSGEVEKKSIPFINLVEEIPIAIPKNISPTFSQDSSPLFNFSLKNITNEHQEEKQKASSTPLFSDVKSQPKKRKRNSISEDPKKKQKFFENSTNPITKPRTNVPKISESIRKKWIIDENTKKKPLEVVNPSLFQENQKKKKKKIVEYSTCGCWSCVDFGRKYYPGKNIIQMY